MYLPVLILEIIGTVAFSISGALTGVRKNMDIFGVCILGLTTAVGGGIIRDLVLGITPPTTFVNPVYAIIAIVTAAVTFFAVVMKKTVKHYRTAEILMLIMDSVGLGIFTVVGIRTAFSVMETENLFLFIFVGVVTGCGGGVMRDLFAGNTPYIFVKHFYACASLVGAVLCTLMWKGCGEAASIITGAAVVIALRLCAAKFRWSLPRPDRFGHRQE